MSAGFVLKLIAGLDVAADDHEGRDQRERGQRGAKQNHFGRIQTRKSLPLNRVHAVRRHHAQALPIEHLGAIERASQSSIRGRDVGL